jgi:hypothetical protein
MRWFSRPSKRLRDPGRSDVQDAGLSDPGDRQRPNDPARGARGGHQAPASHEAHSSSPTNPAAVVLLNHSAPPAPADQNPNNTLCKGHVTKGKADPDDPDSGVVEYSFACSQAITGYSIMPDKAATAFETEVFGVEPVTKEIAAIDAFSCNGSQPGWGASTALARRPATGTRSRPSSTSTATSAPSRASTRSCW